MKTSFITTRNIATQVKFRLIKKDKTQLNSVVFSFIRLKNPLSLIYKTILLNDLFGLTEIVKKKSDFLFISAQINSNYLKLDPQFNIIYKNLYQPLNLNDNTRINNITYKKKFSLSLTITDLISVIKRNKIENQYDFFNYPVKFNATIELTVKDYIAVSTFKNGL